MRFVIAAKAYCKVHPTTATVKLSDGRELETAVGEVITTGDQITSATLLTDHNTLELITLKD